MEFVVGIIVGALLYYVFGARRKYSGTFIIDFTNPDKDICRIELDEHPDIICSRKHISLKVKYLPYISHE